MYVIYTTPKEYFIEIKDAFCDQYNKEGNKVINCLLGALAATIKAFDFIVLPIALSVVIILDNIFGVNVAGSFYGPYRSSYDNPPEQSPHQNPLV